MLPFGVFSSISGPKPDFFEKLHSISRQAAEHRTVTAAAKAESGCLFAGLKCLFQAVKSTASFWRRDHAEHICQASRANARGFNDCDFHGPHQFRTKRDFARESFEYAGLV
jgi:hypothetical protein